MRRVVSPSLVLVSGTASAFVLAQSTPSGPPDSSGNHPGDLTELGVDPSALDFGFVEIGATHALGLTLSNRGFAPLELRRIAFLRGASGDSTASTVTLDGRTFAGSSVDVSRVVDPPIVLAREQALLATVTFAPALPRLDAFVLRFTADDEVTDVPVVGLGGEPDHVYLHVVIEGPSLVVDHDRDASEPLHLDGTASHTHEAGHSIAAYHWRVEGVVVAETPTLDVVLTSPEVEVVLTISDDNVPPHMLESSVDVRMVAPDRVPGVLVRYYDAGETGAEAQLDDPPAAPDFVERRPSMHLAGAVQIGGSPFTGDTLVRIEGRLTVDRLAHYGFLPTGGTGRRLFVDGVEVLLPVLLLPGEHDIEARFAVGALADLPLDVATILDGVSEPIPAERLTHDETRVVPVIHALTASGVPAGGNAVAIEGFGFFTAQDVVVHWGGLDLVAADLTVLTPTRIELLAPPGDGTIQVSVANANGASEPRPYRYELDPPPPIEFRRELVVEVPTPTAGVWAPDGRLYVTSLDGRITALEFDAEYELVAATTYPGVSGLPNHETLAVTTNPYDPPDPVRLYVGHGDHYLHGGQSPTGPSPYTGAISVLTGPDFAAPVALVTGLPVSNNSHGVNGMAFDDNGDLLISVGSMTNAGVQHPGLGDLPESPLSGAVLEARLSKPGFAGQVAYVETASGAPNDDQRFGELVDVAPGIDVEVHAAGLRNAYGLVYTTRGKLYATDNGPNVGYGPASTGPDTEASDPSDSDELNLVEWNGYYGLPNRNRGRADPRQYVFHGGASGPPSIPETLFQMLAMLPSSSDGIDEYRANTFGGQLRGNLIVQRFLGKLRRIRLREDGRAVVEQSVVEPLTHGLGCVAGPGGAIVVLDYQNSEIEVLEPVEAPGGLVAYDVFPWRAPAAGGAPFVISGHGFGTPASTAVTIGGAPAALTEVTPQRIRGLVPAAPEATPALLDVAVTVGGDTSTLPAAFRYLLGAGAEPGRWERLADAAVELGAVAAGAVGGTLYVVGHGTGATLAYDLLAREWRASARSRPHVGRYHAAEVVDGKLYLIGGLGGGAEGRAQIYDPATDAWTTGADLPWHGGAVGTALIDGRIYAAGGLAAGATSRRCASYDPVADAWTSHALMPESRSHAAVGTDGSRLFVFGGRQGLELVAFGRDSVMIYDSAADAWTWSGASGSTLAPLPKARSDMGKAIFLRGEFYVFGGETLDPDAGLDGVHDRVDVYDPVANAWRSEAPMPNARHGSWPVLFQGHVFLAGGGATSGPTRSPVLDTFTRQ